METKLVKVTEQNLDEVAAEAASLLTSGHIAAIPTETVYGLAGSALNDDACSAIFEAKGRPADNPFIVHVSDLLMLSSVVTSLTPEAAELAKRFWPGPLTMILKKSDEISRVATCGLDTVAVRMPSHPVANRIIAEAGIPLAAPSANLSGRPSPTSAQHVFDDMDGRIPLIVDAGSCEVGVESTVVSLAGDVPTILRPGIISLEEIREVLPDAIVARAVKSGLTDGERVLSPGLKYKHYAPRAHVVLIKGDFDSYCEYVRAHAQSAAYAMCFDGETELVGIPAVSYGPEDNPKIQAKRLFSTLRALDKFGADNVFARCPSDEGEGLAVYNRLVRAAGFDVVEL